MRKVKILNVIIHFLVTFDHTNRIKDLELYLAGKCWSWSPLIWATLFITQKNHSVYKVELELTVSTAKIGVEK